MEPLIVRAHLATGIAHTGPWGIALDGILAAQIWANHKATAPYRRAMDSPDPPPDLDLPLARCEVGAPLWHWAATCSYPEDHADQIDVRIWTARVDHRDLEQLTVGLPATVSSRQGRYRAHRMPLLVTPTPSVSWRAIGDPAAIHDLLAGITSIGKKRAAGEGHVLGWDVIPAPDLDLVAAAHTHLDHSLGRPCPPACRALLGPDITDGGIGYAGLRPPYMHPAMQHPGLVLPALIGATP